MKTLRQVTARILVHSEGVGAPNTSDVRKRAEELALINGHDKYTSEDWHQAKIELHGGHGPDGETSDEMAMYAMVSERDMLATDFGHHTDRCGMEDERSVVEELYAEGMEEAEHERMLAARLEMREMDEDEAELGKPGGRVE